MGPAHAPKPGDTIDGKYALIRLLGTGGMGVVFEAEHLRLKQRCAIKMLSPEMLGQPEIVHRFEREARASALLRSPHVTRVTDVATTPDGVPYIVMELLSGHDLDSVLVERGSLPFAEAVDYLLQACIAIAEAHHAGIIHRDLKPGNLFVAHSQEGVMVKVLDFGISKILAEASNLTSANMTMGTALYMSPEQLRSAAKVDARSDIWSLGVILYELLCGEPPFRGTPAQIAVAIVSDKPPDLGERVPIPPGLAAAVHRALQRAPADRFSTIADFAEAIAPFAPVGSVGHGALSQLSRRSPPSMFVLPATTSVPQVVDVGAPTVPRDVSTGVAHEVTSGAKPDGASRRLMMAMLATVGIVAALGLATVAVFALRKAPSQAGAAQPTTSATAELNDAATASSGSDAAAAVTTVASASAAPGGESAPAIAASAHAKPAIPAATSARSVARPVPSPSSTHPAHPSAPPTAAQGNPTFLP